MDPKNCLLLKLAMVKQNIDLKEEEWTLGGGVTLKLNSKPKLDKISPGLWIAANARIMEKFIDEDVDFDAASYLRYTQMIGELAVRFTWASVVIFDDEYRQRQARTGFDLGTEALHLSTVLLRERPTAATAEKKKTVPQKGRASGTVCIQFNRGHCNYGAQCNFEHTCMVCGSKLHGKADHPTNGAGSTGSSGDNGTGAATGTKHTQ